VLPPNVTLKASAWMSVQQQLNKLLKQNGVRIIALFRDWDRDGDGKVSKKEFAMAMVALGYDAPRTDVDAVFDSFDSDRSGYIEYGELKRGLLLEDDEASKTMRLEAEAAAAAAQEEVAALLALSMQKKATRPVRSGTVQKSTQPLLELGLFELCVPPPLGCRLLRGSICCEGTNFFSARLATMHSTGDANNLDGYMVTLQLVAGGGFASLGMAALAADELELDTFLGLQPASVAVDADGYTYALGRGQRRVEQMGRLGVSSGSNLFTDALQSSLAGAPKMTLIIVGTVFALRRENVEVWRYDSVPANWAFAVGGNAGTSWEVVAAQLITVQRQDLDTLKSVRGRVSV